jgi:ABC-type antimicrobial peptide transport system permease subunit
MRLVLREGLVLIIIGLSIGMIGAFVLTRALSSLLYGIQPTDPLTFAGVSLLLAVVTLAASCVPARRATRVDPLVALRYE